MNGSLINCYVTGTIRGDALVGGVVGDLYNSSVTSCYSACAISGTSVVGGMAGKAYLEFLRNGLGYPQAAPFEAVRVAIL